jgi:hypothetical protein
MDATVDRMLSPGRTGFRGGLLDIILAKGYFRAGPWMYYTVTYDTDTGGKGWSYKVRVRLTDRSEKASTRRIRRSNAGFHHVISPMRIGEAEEGLYARYRASVDFEAAPTLREALLHGGQEADNPFDTRMVSVSDGTRLIAVGYFDLGRQAMAGILNLFDPDYRSHSPGKYLMLLKMDHALDLGMHYFHPGTVHIGDGKMDYKFFPGREAMDAYLSPADRWQPALTLDTDGLVAMYEASASASG